MHNKPTEHSPVECETVKINHTDITKERCNYKISLWYFHFLFQSTAFTYWSRMVLKGIPSNISPELLHAIASMVRMHWIGRGTSIFSQCRSDGIWLNISTALPQYTATLTYLSRGYVIFCAFWWLVIPKNYPECYYNAYFYGRRSVLRILCHWLTTSMTLTSFILWCRAMEIRWLSQMPISPLIGADVVVISTLSYPQSTNWISKVCIYLVKPGVFLHSRPFTCIFF